MKNTEKKSKPEKTPKTPHFSDFARKIETAIKSEIHSADVGVYEVQEDYFLKVLLGEELNRLVTERYLALSETTIFSNPLGISDNSKYMNRMVTTFYCDNHKYLLIVSSYALEKFENKTTVEIILDIIKQMGGEVK
jgi:hypothetical protein